MDGSIKPSRGGARPNSGAPKKGADARVTLTIRLHPTTIAKLKKLAEDGGKNVTRYIEQMIEQA